jgi:peptidylprolyl isomerase
MKSSTPIVVTVAAVLIGTGAAYIAHLQTPAAPPEVGLAEAAAPAAPTTKPAIVLAPGDQHVTKSGLTIVEVKDGTGLPSNPGDTVKVNYIGRLYYGGAQFDNSYDRGEPFEVVLGSGQVIPGFDEGATGMRVGAKREVVIPPDQGYGPAGAGDKIPPNSTLVFDLEMMKITPPAPPAAPTALPPPPQ